MSLRNIGLASALISALVISHVATSSDASAKGKKQGPVAGAININGQGSSFVDPLLTDAAQNGPAGGACTSNFPATGKNGWLNVYGIDLNSGSALAGGFAGNQAPGAPNPFGNGPVNSNLAMSYGSIGSGGGKIAYFNAAPNNTGTSTCEYVSGPYAFSGTDNPYSIAPADPTTVTAAGGAKLVQIPSTIGAVATIYNKGVKLTAGRTNSLGETVSVAKALTRKELCAIFEQTITDWNDIDSANPNGSTIRIKARFGGSGTTLILGRQLQANCGNGPWTLTSGTFPNNVNNNAASWAWNNLPLVDSSLVTNKDVADDVKAKTFSIGAVDAALAKLNGNVIPKLQNKALKYVAPASAGVLAAFKNVVDIDTTLPGNQSRIELGVAGNPSATWDPTDPKAYPIVGATYFWFYGLNSSGDSWYNTNGAFDAGTRTAIKDFIEWYTTKSTVNLTDADKIISQVTGYGPLPGGKPIGTACANNPAATDIKCLVRKLINDPTNGI
ncbi:MAG: substrate-binding domain-containing protein [Thermosynechococcaceae cyanobacterium]